VIAYSLKDGAWHVNTFWRIYSELTTRIIYLSIDSFKHFSVAVLIYVYHVLLPVFHFVVVSIIDCMFLFTMYRVAPNSLSLLSMIIKSY